MDISLHNPASDQGKLVAFPLTETAQPDRSQLDNIKAQLDLVLLALEALVGIGSEAVLQAAADLNLQDVVSDRVSLWRLRQSNPLRRGTGGRKNWI